MRVLIALLIALGIPSPLRAQILEQSFSDTLAHFKITLPNHQWNFQPRGIDPGDSKLTIRFESSLNQFVPNVNVRMTENVDPAKLSEWIETELKRLPQSWEILEKNVVTHRGMQGYEIFFKDTQNAIRFHQRFFPVNGNLYVLTCTAKEASYPRVQEDFLKILNSFEII